MSRVLGVDVGLKRTGLAVSDELRVSVRALANLIPKSRAEDVAALVGTITELDVRDVVIGLPLLPRSGDDGAMAKRVRGFAGALHAALTTHALPCRVHLLDERHSSTDATARLVASGIRRDKRKAALDGEVARGLVLALLQGESTEIV